MAPFEFLTSESDLRMMQDFSEELVAASKEFADFISSSAQLEETVAVAASSQFVETTSPQTESPAVSFAEPDAVADHPQEMEKIVFGPQPYRTLGE